MAKQQEDRNDEELNTLAVPMSFYDHISYEPNYFMAPHSLVRNAGRGDSGVVGRSHGDCLVQTEEVGVATYEENKA